MVKSFSQELHLQTRRRMIGCTTWWQNGIPTRMQGRTYPLGKGRRLSWAPKRQGPPKMLFIYEMRIKHRQAKVNYNDNHLCVPSWTCFLCILLVANENIMHLKLTAAQARGLSFPARVHLFLSLSASALFCARTHLFTLAAERSCAFS